jgi:chemotaxis signal transduction protein
MSEDVRKYLIFTLAGKRYAFNLTQVAEVVEQPATWPIPLAPSCYLGAINFHGTIVAVMDLAAFIGLPGAQSLENVIVLDTRIASLAFTTESITRIIMLNHNGISAPAGDNAFATAEMKLADGMVTLLDASEIAAHAAKIINNQGA